MKQYALLAFLSPVASLLAVTGPAQSEKLKTKTNPQKHRLATFAIMVSTSSSVRPFLNPPFVFTNAMEPKTYKLPM